MSALTEDEFTKYEKSIQADLWKFRKEFYHGEESEEYWERLYAECNRISEKHRSLYVDNMLIVCIDDIEVRLHKSQNRPVDELEHFQHIVHVLERDRKKEG